MKGTSRPPPWRKVAAALRDFFKPERDIATTQAPPAPARRLTPGQEGLVVAEFHVEVERAVNAHKAKARAGEPADSGVLLADLSRWIDDFVKWKMPEHSPAERQPLVERLRLELAGLVAAAWWPKPAPKPAPAPSVTELPVAFPAGTKFFDVDGVPVTRAPESWICRAWDPDPRFFPPFSVLRRGELISETRFRELVAAARQPTAPTPPGRTAEQQALIEKLRRELPDALVRNLNRSAQAELPVRPSAAAMAARIELTPQQQTQLAEFNAGIGQVLANNLNENVRDDQQGRPDVMPTTKPERGEFFDYEGIPCSLGMAGVRSSLAWDTDPPRVFDPVSMRRNGAPITWAQFRAMVEQLPAGTLFFDVEGVPVYKTPGWVVRAWDPDPRPFSILSLMRNGETISEARFRQMVAFERSRCDTDFQAFLVRAAELPADGDQLRLFN